MASTMKRSKKLELKSETVRHLTGTEMNQVNGGLTVYATARNCQQGGAATGDGSITSEYEIKINQIYYP